MTTQSPEPSETEAGDAVRRPRRWPWILVLLLLAAAGTCLTAWSARVELANAYAPDIVQRISGLPVQFHVARLDSDLIRLRDIAVGVDGPTLDTLEAVPDWTGLRGLVRAMLFGRDGAAVDVPVDVLRLSGLKARLTIGPDGGPRITGLPGRAADAGPGDTDLPPLPARRIEVTALDISAQTPLGTRRLTGAITLSFPEAPALLPATAEAQLDAPDSESALIGTVALTAASVRAQATLDLSLDHWLAFLPAIDTAQGRVTARLSLEGSPDAAAAPDLAGMLAAVNGTAEIAWTGVRAVPIDLPGVTLADGVAQASLSAGRVQLLLPQGWEAAADRLPPDLSGVLPDGLRPYAEGPLRLTLMQTGTPPAAEIRSSASGGWSAAFGLAAEAAIGPLFLSLTPRRLGLGATLSPGILEMEEIRLTAVRGLDLPRDAAGSLAIAPFSLDLARLSDPGTPLPPITLPYTLQAGVYGPLAGPLWAERAELDIAGEARLSEAAETLSLTVNPGGSLRLTGLTGTGDVRLSPRLRLDVAGRDPMRVSLRPGDPEGSLALDGAFRLGELSLALPGATAPFALTLARQPVSVSYGPNRLSLAMGPTDVSAPGHDAVLRGTVLRLALQDRTASADVTASGLRYAGAPILPGSMTVSLSAGWEEDGRMMLDGPISLADGRITANLAVRSDPNSDEPTEIDLETAPIRFAPGGLTLPDLLPPPVLDALPRVPALEGALSVRAALRLPERGPEGTLTLDLDGMTAEMPDGALRALSGTLTFDASRLPATRGMQTLQGTVALRGLPPIPLTARFAAAEDASLTIESLSLGLFDGGIALIDATLDPAGPALEGTLRLRHLDMAQAVAAAAIDGVTAQGRLSGLIPLRVGAEDAVIRNGTLAAEGSGLLRIDNPAVNEALATDQDAVQLLTEALKDFRYDKLSAEVELPPGEDGRLALSLSGNNPAVLDGHPFAINVNLETDFRRLFSILRDFLDASASILGGVRQGTP